MIPHQHDFILPFGNYLVPTMVLITMIPSIHKNVHYPLVKSFSVSFKLLLLVDKFVSFLDEKKSWIHWPARRIRSNVYKCRSYIANYRLKLIHSFTIKQIFNFNYFLVLRINFPVWIYKVNNWLRCNEKKTV